MWSGKVETRNFKGMIMYTSSQKNDKVPTEKEIVLTNYRKGDPIL